MTAKQKAKELVVKFSNIKCGVDSDGEQWYLDEYCSPKICALICVDEVLSIEGNYLISTDYWKEVKQEINQV